ncbi:Hypothetical protein ORPV_351 [Orpheovirus IHUMI-LCC2]|uniref:Uncharacterized protein n=1 Tax=Orpheovirus IHUMI-LCC2 TaxID=2023057 RepID=A0A2I2L3X4_9VIRU|nr:Hypothetical protein ORPV_351 [Orpheovirus IHUMI-LCC2]SNW62255.1 Hypothetical protein ORPV_351 [Orpheovirus IHUMI-LCC2]
MERFLDIFEYERREDGEQNSIFYNCKFLKDYGKCKAQDVVYSLSISLTLYIFAKDDILEGEVTSYL